MWRKYIWKSSGVALDCVSEAEHKRRSMIAWWKSYNWRCWGTRGEQEEKPGYENLEAYPLWPTSSAEAPPLKHATVFPDTTSWRSSVQTHEHMGNISHPNHHSYQISHLANGVNISNTWIWPSHLLACLFLLLLCCTEMEMSFISDHLSNSSAHFRAQHLLCHTSFSATRKPFVHPLHSFDT